MTKRNAEKCCEIMAEINDHFYNYCMNNGYAAIDKIYNCFAIKYPSNPRTILREYRKKHGFTEEQYHYWNKNYGWHYGNLGTNTTI